jgi:hypothetical protein
MVSGAYEDLLIVSFALVTNQSLGSAVERMPVVSSELGVGSLERRVSAGLRLLDTVREDVRQHQFGPFRAMIRHSTAMGTPYSRPSIQLFRDRLSDICAR